MAGISDTRQPDDIKQHVETIIAADDERSAIPDGETEEQRVVRESAKLPPWLRARADAVKLEIEKQVPGLTAAETAKLLTTRAGRDALAKGEAALSRIDSHLQSVTGERNPIIGKKYGVYGANPETFAGVYRALDLSVNENAAVAALPADDPERRRLFSPLIQREVQTATDELARLIGARLGSRAELSRAVTLKDATLKEAASVVTAVREHLYANLPNRKQDDDLRDYGFQPLDPGRGRRTTDPAPPNPGAPPVAD